MRIDITVTDDEYSARFVEGCAGLWGVYRGTRFNVTANLQKRRSDLERRYAEVHAIDGITHGKYTMPDDDEPFAAELRRDLDTYRWVCEECPLIALAIMVAEWDA